MPEDDPELPEVPVEDEPLVLEPPEISDVLPDPLFFSGSGVESTTNRCCPWSRSYPSSTSTIAWAKGRCVLPAVRFA